MIRSTVQARRHLTLAFVAIALMARILVPHGWMPSAEAGRSTITLCTGAGMVEAWVDTDGKIHKSSPDRGGKTWGACVFACLGIALGAALLGFVLARFLDLSGRGRALRFSDNVWHGLAAPPPPARGPPLLT